MTVNVLEINLTPVCDPVLFVAFHRQQKYLGI